MANDHRNYKKLIHTYYIISCMKNPSFTYFRNLGKHLLDYRCPSYYPYSPPKNLPFKQPTPYYSNIGNYFFSILFGFKFGRRQIRDFGFLVDKDQILRVVCESNNNFRITWNPKDITNTSLKFSSISALKNHLSSSLGYNPILSKEEVYFHLESLMFERRDILLNPLKDPYSFSKDSDLASILDIKDITLTDYLYTNVISCRKSFST